MDFPVCFNGVRSYTEADWYPISMHTKGEIFSFPSYSLKTLSEQYSQNRRNKINESMTRKYTNECRIEGLQSPRRHSQSSRINFHEVRITCDHRLIIRSLFPVLLCLYPSSAFVYGYCSIQDIDYIFVIKASLWRCHGWEGIVEALAICNFYVSMAGLALERWTHRCPVIITRTHVCNWWFALSTTCYISFQIHSHNTVVDSLYLIYIFPLC